jgi:hypothetical protein
LKNYLRFIRFPFRARELGPRASDRLDLHAGLVVGVGLEVGGDGVVDDAVAAGLGGEADGEGALERLLALEGPGAGRPLLERREVVGALLLDLHLGDSGAGDEDQFGFAAARAGLEGERGGAGANDQKRGQRRGGEEDRGRPGGHCWW